MDINDDLISAFIEEAREHLPVIESSLLQLERNPNDQALLNELFRSIHTIKGGAGFFGLTQISTLTHSMESVLTLAKNQKLLLSRENIDVLLNSQDRLVQMIDDPENSHLVSIKTECEQLEQLLESNYAQRLNTDNQFPAENADEVFVSSPKSDDESFEFYKQDDEVLDNASTSPQEQNDLIDSFLEEAKQCATHVEKGLLALENSPGNITVLNDVFRHIHTIKGGAHFLGFHAISNLTHVMEDILGLAKNANLILDEHCIDTLLEVYDCLLQLLSDEQTVSDCDVEMLCQRLNALKPIALTQPESSLETKSKPIAFTAPKNTTPIIQSQISSPSSDPVAEKSWTAEESNHPAHVENEESIRVHVKRLNKLIDLAGELVLVRNQFVRLCEPLMPQVPGLKPMLHNFNRITSEMQEEIMSTRMQPIGIIFNKFPRLIRQLEKDLGKRIDLVTEGADVELDKTIIEALNDPVTHIIRNMADHGIEKPEQRLNKGKPINGTLLQKAFHESGQVVIQFSDDGAGIDPDFVANRAVQKGIISQEILEKLSVKEKINLIFTPGFSTADNVSSVSGRGIGMDVVKTNIEQIGGTIDVNSEVGKWTSITMTLPLTMAIIAALIVRVGYCRFAFPQANLEEMVLLNIEDYDKKVGEVRGKKMLCLRGRYLPLVSLAQTLSMDDDISAHILDNPDKPLHILIIKADNNRAAIIVDQILGSEEIVVKPMPDYFKSIKNFSGTSILGDGAIAMIIDVQGYIHKNQLIYTSLQKDESVIEARKVEQETQSLLIFDNHTDEHFALVLAWIKRIDTVSIEAIQQIANKEYIEYRGEQMRLLRLEFLLPVHHPKTYTENANIIIPKHTKLPVALLINKVIDTQNTAIKLENSAIKTPGILGSMLLDGKIILLLDLYRILEMGEPDSIEKLEFNPEKTKSKSILLVEDTPFFIKVITEFILDSGYQITVATNGREGLDKLAEQNFDLVLSDIEMPIINGLEMIKRIRANPSWTHMPVIALTTLSDAQTIAEGKRAGFNDWLVKLDKELVLKTLAKYLG